MKVEDVCHYAKQKGIPSHLIERLLAEIEFDRSGNVVDEFAVSVMVNELAYNVECIRRNLNAVQRLKQKKREQTQVRSPLSL
jgi:hypothetical protein